MQAEKEWDRLRKKWKKLPDWKWISSNFRGVKTEEGDVIKSVHSAAMGKIEDIAREMIEPIIGGSENYCCYFERKMLGESEREKLFDIYRQLMALLWAGNVIAINFSEKEFVEWMSVVKQKWDILKPKVVEFADKLSTSWEKYKKLEEGTAYHG